MEIAIALFAIGGLAALVCGVLVVLATTTKDPWKLREEKRGKSTRFSA
jgi:hypothetical protein